MRVSNYSLLLPEGRECDSGHVEMVHGTVYTIRLGNHDYRRRCDATVEVDGKNVGCFRLNEGASLTLERSADDTGRFTFFAADSQEGQQVGAAGISRDDRGLVRVTFRPEKERPRPVQTTHHYRSASVGGAHFAGAKSAELTCGSIEPQNCSAGVTGLTGRSDQSFYTVANLDYDPTGEVTITLRIVCSYSPTPRPLTAVTPRANPVPSPVE